VIITGGEGKVKAKIFLLYDNIPWKSSCSGDIVIHGYYDSKKNEGNAHQDEHFPCQGETKH